MRHTSRDGGFLLCLLINLALNLEWTIPAWVLLILHFALGWSIWWFVGAMALWLLVALVLTALLAAANRYGSEKVAPRPNRNPYSVSKSRPVPGFQAPEDDA